MLISKALPNLINGVSQQPAISRLDSQCELQENALSSIVNGLMKRPPTEHVAMLDGLRNTSNAFFHLIKTSLGETLLLIIIPDGNTYLFDRYGKRLSVNVKPAAQSYITTANPSKNLTATSVADYTFITNTQVVVKRTNKKTPKLAREFLFYVKKGNYQTKYSTSFVSKHKIGELMTFSWKEHKTGRNDDAGRETVKRNNICSTFASHWRDTFGSLAPDAGFEVKQRGPVFTVKNTQDKEVIMTATDDMGGDDFKVFYKQTKDLKELPEDAIEGFKIKISGDTDVDQDDFYVEYTNNSIEESTSGDSNYLWELAIENNPTSYWKEIAKPDSYCELDARTMPVALIKAEAGSPYDYHLTCLDGDTLTQDNEAPKWDDREAGDDDTNPFPSFVGRRINDIFFHKNRLGVLSDENVIFSEASNFFNFFANTVQTMVDSSPIDVSVSSTKVSVLKHAIPFDDSLLLFSDRTQFKVTSQGALTNETVEVNPTTEFEADLSTEPVSSGRSIFFASDKGAWSGIREYSVDADSSVTDASDVTAHVPNYLEGKVRSIAASSSENSVLVLTEGEKDTVYIYRYYWQGNEKLQSAWSKWVFSGTVLSADFDGPEIILLVERNGGYYIETMNLSLDTAEAVMDAGLPVHLDRRVLLRKVGDTVPYQDLKTQFVTAKGRVVGDPSASLAAGIPVYAGTPFNMRYVFSEQMSKDANGQLLPATRTQMRRFLLNYTKTGHFNFTVKADSRDDKTQVFSPRIIGAGSNILNKAVASSGVYRTHVLSKLANTALEISTDSWLPCTLQSAEWEGIAIIRTQRV